MGSSETGGVGEVGVGSIVWVRRRNGSWWPGKILGPEELSSSILTSPRSGTPVKLLGREDASVDWYNLEKSKRVKAFRCGEFDDCIERAEAAQGMPPKKREKYARREDAILHALDLERQIAEKKYGKLEYSSNGRSKKSPEAVTSSAYLGNGGGKQKDPRSAQISERLGSSVAQKNVVDHHLYNETVREGNQLSGEDDNAGAMPRMRGLQDFGLRTAPPSREELTGVAFSAKRGRHGYLPHESGDYSNGNRIQPSQTEILVSRVGENDCSYPADMDEDVISGSTEDTETDCSETDSMESDSDNDMNVLSDADGSASIELQPKYPRRVEAHEFHGSISSCDDLDESTYAEESSHPFPSEHASTSSDVSKWPLKGKRKHRGLVKMSLDGTDAEESPRGYINGRNSNWSNNGFKTGSVEKSVRTQMPIYVSTGLHSSTHDSSDIESLNWNNEPAVKGYWDDCHDYIDPSFLSRHQFGSSRVLLVDVDLKVQASNYRRDVPMISLMSKLNGHAIVGHPIQVETLESGSSEHFLTSSGYFFHEPVEGPGSLPRAWSTGRRTANSRVRRPHLSSALDANNKQYAHFVDQERTNILRKSSSRNSHKTISPTSNQKIRMLSSISSEQKHQGSRVNNSQVGGLIKSEYVPTTVACIPVNLVFSRLHEELVGRHP